MVHIRITQAILHITCLYQMVSILILTNLKVIQKEILFKKIPDKTIAYPFQYYISLYKRPCFLYLTLDWATLLATLD